MSLLSQFYSKKKKPEVLRVDVIAQLGHPAGLSEIGQDGYADAVGDFHFLQPQFSLV